VKNLFLNSIDHQHLFTRKDKILLAVSGGVDSMVLFHLLRACDFQFSVAHVNFQLRGEDSDADEKLVRANCTQHQVPFFSKRMDTEKYAAQHKLSIQMAARALRYQWFSGLAADHHFDCIATAHHANDSLETTLLNFVRGAGLEGWDGIASKNGRIVRPLLFASRETIETYARQNNIAWREDRSNATDDYQRNFLRHQVVPRLKELNPSLEISFRESASKVSGSVELMELGIAHWKEKFQTTKDEQIHFSKEGFVVFNDAGSVLWNLVKSYGFNLDQCHQLAASIGETGRYFSSPTHELVLDREKLILSPLPSEEEDVRITTDQSEYRRGKLSLSVQTPEGTRYTSSPSVASLDLDKIEFPLVWRSWQPGDSFHPLGMNHRKKLSDFFIDEKISLADKKNISVLESTGEIIWIVGLRIDDRFKITEHTKRTISLHLAREN
jgi:tRNA(Ile)-lysidine synthase